MTDRRRLSMTRDKAAALKRLLGSVAQQAGSMATQPRGLGRLLVEATAQMPAAATTPVQCKILTINGTTITDTGCRIGVLNVGPRAIASGTKCYAEPCGRLGYCVSRPAQGNPATRGELWRDLAFVQMLEAERENENATWAWGTWNTLGSTGGIQDYHGAQGYYLSFDDSVDTGEYTRTFYPNAVRLKIDGWGSGYQGVYGRQDVPRQAPLYHAPTPYDAARGARIGGGNQFDPPLYQFNAIRGTQAPIASARSDKLPPAFHLPDYRSEGLSFGRAFANNETVCPFCYGPGDYNIIVKGWPQRLFSGAVQYVVTHGRLWLDGTDETGIVPVTGRLFEGTSPTTYGIIAWDADITDNAKTVEVDLWFKVRITVDNATTPGPIDQIAWLGLTPGNPAAIIGSHASYGPTGPLEFSFDANGPAGATSLNTVGQSGWDVYEAGYLRFTDNANTPTNGQMWFHWNQETPFIVIYKRNTATAPGTGFAWYLPEDTSDYQPLILPSGAGMAAGTWDPSTATVFRRVAGNVGTSSGGWTDIHGAGSPTAWDSLYDDFPSTVTVEPYTP